ncbi:MAG: phosphatase PAP2 family protein [Polyangiaceae bacterium]
MPRKLTSTGSVLPLAAALAITALSSAACAQSDPSPRQLSEPPPAPPTAEAPRSRDPVDAHFHVDPITDGAILSVGVGFSGLLEWIIGTGELQPQQPGDTDRLLPIDRGIVDVEPSSTANTISNVGALTTVAYAVGTTLESGYRGGMTRALVDGMIYAETAALTLAVTDLAKISVRRPRPSAYRARDQRVAQGLSPDLSGTDNALSFFSGHAAITAALSTTATYLAFAREESPLRGYLTLAGGVIVTGLVDWGRVYGGKHFPTDVIAGTMAGIGVGLLVPHLHRVDDESTPLWVAFAPVGGGSGISAGGAF